jgi:hypothetical protein
LRLGPGQGSEGSGLWLLLHPLSWRMHEIPMVPKTLLCLARRWRATPFGTGSWAGLGRFGSLVAPSSTVLEDARDRDFSLTPNQEPIHSPMDGLSGRCRTGTMVGSSRVGYSSEGELVSPMGSLGVLSSGACKGVVGMILDSDSSSIAVN